MTEPPYQTAEDAKLEPISEDELARFLEERGTRTQFIDGRHWRFDQGRYQPTHFYAQLSRSEIKRPSSLCWAYRAALADGDHEAANGRIPLHLIADLDLFTLSSLRASKRRQVRASSKNLRFVELANPDILYEQGLAVLRSAVERHGYGRLHEEASYRKSIDPFFRPRRGLILGALRGSDLAGYITLYAVGDIGYVDEVHLATGLLETQVGPGLTYQAIEACKRSPHIKTLVHSLAIPERPGLTRFKEQMGFPVVEVPAYYWIAPGAKQLLRKLRPNAYYRFTGDPSGLQAAT